MNRGTRRFQVGVTAAALFDTVQQRYKRIYYSRQKHALTLNVGGVVPWIPRA